MQDNPINHFLLWLADLWLLRLSLTNHIFHSMEQEELEVGGRGGGIDLATM